MEIYIRCVHIWEKLLVLGAIHGNRMSFGGFDAYWLGPDMDETLTESLSVTL